MEGDELDSGDIIVRDYMSIDYNTKVNKSLELDASVESKAYGTRN